MKIILSIIICTTILSSNAHAESGIPYVVERVGVVGPNFVRLFAPGKIEVNGKAIDFDNYYVLSTNMINTLESVGDQSCLMNVSSLSASERISVLKQTCDQIIKQVKMAIELSNEPAK